jgi:hypothetical protein
MSGSRRVDDYGPFVCNQRLCDGIPVKTAIQLHVIQRQKEARITSMTSRRSNTSGLALWAGQRPWSSHSGKAMIEEMRCLRGSWFWLLDRGRHYCNLVWRSAAVAVSMLWRGPVVMDGRRTWWHSFRSVAYTTSSSSAARELGIGSQFIAFIGT